MVNGGSATGRCETHGGFFETIVVVNEGCATGSGSQTGNFWEKIDV